MIKCRDGIRQAHETAKNTRKGLGGLAKFSGALRIGTQRGQNALQAVIDQYWRIENTLNQQIALLDERFPLDDD